MTVHVLHAGDGYSYLTSQVAAADHTRSAGEKLADYYTATGCPEGRWMGAGTAGLGVAGAVAEAQMKALFGAGAHPVTGEQLGRKQYSFADRGTWDSDLAAEYKATADKLGIAPTALSRETRNEARLRVGERSFRAAHGRAPVDETEVRGHIAKAAKPRPQTVAGFDLVFTPAKSVSVLWGLGSPEIRAAVEAAHHEAVADTIGWLEGNAIFTRTGVNGVAQVDCHGVVAAAFDHFDSRSGDPNLHTHVAVANRVQGVDGKWRALDSRALHKAGVAASERYNTVIEDLLRDRLGVGFRERSTGRGKQPIRELDIVEDSLIKSFSSRRTAIEATYDELAATYRAEHGRDPEGPAALKLYQQATLSTRTAKGPVESLATKQNRWTQQAWAAAPEAAAVVRDFTARPGGVDVVDADLVNVPAVAEVLVDRLGSQRSRWNRWHLTAEAQRLIRAEIPIASAHRDRLVEEVVATALAGSMTLGAPELAPVPEDLQRASGESVFTSHADQWFTSPAVLAAEDRLLDAAAARVEPLAAWVGDGDARVAGLNPGQVSLVNSFAATDRFLTVGIGPAGSGKTTAMSAFARIVENNGHRVIGLAPSAAAAKVLGDELGVQADTIAKLLDTITRQGPEAAGINAGDCLLVDEAGMAATGDLDRLVQFAAARGAVVRLLGDPAQLGAVQAGGALRMLAQRHGAIELSELHRFTDPAEAAATLAARTGDEAAIDFWEDAGRITDGERQAMIEAVFSAWLTDPTGRVMVAADNATVSELSDRARLVRVTAGLVDDTQTVRLVTGARAGVGDLVVTRLNDRRLATGTDFVKNGDLWEIVSFTPEAAAVVRHHRHGGTVTLPADYLASNVELGYALTIHRAQGMTTGQAHVLVDEAMTRESLYVAMSRGREGNYAYVVTEATIGEAHQHDPETVDPAHAAVHVDDHTATPREVLSRVLSTESAELSAHDTLAAAYDQAESLALLVPAYEYGLDTTAATTARGRLVDVLGVDTAALLGQQHAWPSLARAVVDVPAETVAAEWAAMQTHPVEARDPAAVLAARLHAHATTPRTLHAWANHVPGTPSTEAGELAGWLDTTAARITARIEDQTARVLDESPAWLTDTVGEPASDPSWREAVTAIAAYRDRYQITHQGRALGYEPNPGTRQHRDYLAAQQQAAQAKAIERAHDAALQRLAEIKARATAAPAQQAPESDAAARLRAIRERLNQQPERREDPTPDYDPERDRGPEL